MQGVIFQLREQVLIALLIIGAITATLGQKPKFKKVSKEELEKTVCEYDRSAKAEYLYHGCKVIFDFNRATGSFEVIYFFHDRIKIYNEDAIGLADQILRYYSVRKGSESEKISGLSAYTFNLENGKIKSEKLDKENIYDEKLNDYYSAKKFAMPALKAGSVLDIKYELRSPHYFRMDEFYFQKDFPVKYTEYEVKTPEYYNYNYNIKGLVILDVDESNSQGRINFTSVSRNDGFRASQSTTSFETLTFTENIKKYSASNVPAIKTEPFVYSMDNFKGSIRLELLFTKFPRSGIKYYTLTWDDIAERLDQSDSFGDQIRKNYNEMDGLLEKVEPMAETEKIATIFFTIQNMFTWNSRSNMVTDKGIKNLLKEETGNSAEINLLLVNMLQKAGINAYPMVYKKQSSGYLNYTSPTLAELDYVVAVIVTENKMLYLDATDKHILPGMLPQRALNLRGVVIMDKKGTEVMIQNQNKGGEVKQYTLKLDKESLKGKYKQITKKYDAYISRVTHKSSEDYLKELQNDDIHLTNAEVKDFKNSSKSISVSAEINLKGFTQAIDDKIFIDLMVGQNDFKNPFESEERNFALFFRSFSSNTKLIKLEIPEGYKVESIPENLNISTPEGHIKYSIKAQVVGKEIVITIRNSINKTIISPEFYGAVRFLYDKVVEKSKEKIVLSKI